MKYTLVLCLPLFLIVGCDKSKMPSKNAGCYKCILITVDSDYTKHSVTTYNKYDTLCGATSGQVDSMIEASKFNGYTYWNGIESGTESKNLTCNL